MCLYACSPSLSSHAGIEDRVQRAFAANCVDPRSGAPATSQAKSLRTIRALYARALPVSTASRGTVLLFTTTYRVDSHFFCVSFQTFVIYPHSPRDPHTEVDTGSSYTRTVRSHSVSHSFFQARLLISSTIYNPLRSLRLSMCQHPIPLSFTLFVLDSLSVPCALLLFQLSPSQSALLCMPCVKSSYSVGGCNVTRRALFVQARLPPWFSYSVPNKSLHATRGS